MKYKPEKDLQKPGKSKCSSPQNVNRFHALSPLVFDEKEILSELPEMMTTFSTEKQCSNIADWFKRLCYVEAIGFFPRDSGRWYYHIYSDSISSNIFEELKGKITEQCSNKKKDNELLIFSIEKGGIIPFMKGEKGKSTMPAIMVLPLSTRSRLFGVLALITEPSTVEMFTERGKWLSWFMSLVSSLLYCAICHERNVKKVRLLELYQTVSSSLSYIGDLQELLQTIISIVISELYCEEGSVMLYDDETNEFEFFAIEGEAGQNLRAIRFPADKGIAGRVLKERKAMVVNNVGTCPDFYPDIDKKCDFKTRSVLAVPLVAGEENVGVIEAINKLGNEDFGPEDEQILTAIADEVALAVKNAKLFDYVVNSYCKRRQGQNSCKGCKRPLKSWTPCALQMENLK